MNPFVKRFALAVALTRAAALFVSAASASSQVPISDPAAEWRSAHLTGLVHERATLGLTNVNRAVYLEVRPTAAAGPGLAVAGLHSQGSITVGREDHARQVNVLVDSGPSPLYLSRLPGTTTELDIGNFYQASGIITTPATPTPVTGPLTLTQIGCVTNLGSLSLREVNIINRISSVTLKP